MFKALRWFVKKIFIVVHVFAFSRCGSGYSVKDGKTVFNGKEITDKNFKILNAQFATDSLNAYYKEHTIDSADVATFTALDDHYAKDKYKAYYCDEYRDGQSYYLTKKQTIVVVEDAIPGSFVTAGNSYAKDKNQVYFQGLAFTVKDVAGFKSITQNSANDGVTAYLNRKPIAGSDGKTFEVTDGNYAKDKSRIYYYELADNTGSGITAIPCDPASFKILDYRYSKDKDHVFFKSVALKGADVTTITLLPAGYVKDKIAVYFESARMAGVDAGSFEVYKENDSVGHDVVFARDKNSVYIDDKKVAGANPATFKVLGENYGSDDKNVFYKAGIVRNANPATFKVYPHTVGDADAEDNNSKFYKGRTVMQ